MPRHFSIGVLSALAVALCVVQSARADIVTFNDIPNDPGMEFADFHNDLYTGGLHFQERELVIMPVNLNPNPVGQGSRFMEAGNYADVEPITLTSYTGTSSTRGLVQDNFSDGAAFDLWYLKIGLGDGNVGGTDMVTIDGISADGCTSDCNPSQVITVTDHFVLVPLSGFIGVTSVIINQQRIGTADGVRDISWLGFDDITYTTYVGPDDLRPDAPSAVPLTNVPEPAAWALMILGFGGVGAAMRRNRRVGLAAA